MVDEHEAQEIEQEMNKSPVTDQMITDILVTCFEGGSTYWIDRVEVVEWPEGANLASDVPTLGGTLKLYVLEEDEEPLLVDKEAMISGIIEAADNWGMTVEQYVEDHDADSADNALQYAVFGEVIYG